MNHCIYDSCRHPPATEWSNLSKDWIPSNCSKSCLCKLLFWMYSATSSSEEKVSGSPCLSTMDHGGVSDLTMLCVIDKTQIRQQTRSDIAAHILNQPSTTPPLRDDYSSTSPRLQKKCRAPNFSANFSSAARAPAITSYIRRRWFGSGPGWTPGLQSGSRSGNRNNMIKSHAAVSPWRSNKLSEKWI